MNCSDAKKILFTCFLILPLSGCFVFNDYAEFYESSQDYADTVKRRSNPATNNPHVIKVYQNQLNDEFYRNLLKKGYYPIGQSSFNAGAGRSDQDAIEQAKKVMADLVVIMNPVYTNTIQSQMPITTPTTTTTYSSGNATVYGSGGVSNIYGSGTTTTYGTRTTMIPIVTHRMDYLALFYIKINSVFGAFLREIDDKTKKFFNTNYGLMIDILVEDSPAYDAGILPGDIIHSINEIPVNEANSSKIFEENMGKVIVLKISRDGHFFEKTVRLGSY